MKISLPVRFALTSLVIASVGVLSIAIYSYQDAGALLRQQSLDIMTGELTVLSNRFKENIERIQQDVRRITKSDPVMGFNRAIQHGGYDDERNMTTELWKRRLSVDFVNLLQQRPNYLEICYIAQNGEETELTCTQRQDNTVVINQQNPEGRQGFQAFLGETLNLPPGGQTLSKVELSQVMGTIVLPLQPFIRIAGPVYFENRIRGAVAIKVDFFELAEPFSTSSLNVSFMLANEQGDYLLHPDKDRQFTLARGGSPGVNKEFPSLEQSPPTADGFEFLDLPEQSASLIRSHLRYNPQDSQQSILVMALISHEVIGHMSQSFGNRLGIGVIVVVVLICTGMALLAGRLLFPIKQLTEAAEQIANGRDVNLPVIKRNDELGLLAKSFQTMVNHLSSSNSRLEAQTEAIKKSELELQDRHKELQETNRQLVAQSTVLQEQAAQLEIQKNKVILHSIDLENTKNELEAKAHDLEIISEYKSEFLANMSHELRTPLNSILLLSKHLANNNEKNLIPDQLECASAIYSSGSELLRLIDDVLDLSKVESGRMEVTQEQVFIHHIVSNMNQLFLPVATEKGITLEIQVSPNLPQELETDGQRLSQILKNLLSNAFKFTKTGKVSMEIGRPPSTPFHPDIAHLDPQQTIVFIVKDTGIGIPSDKHDSIFEAFTQADGSTSKQYGGTGLGLSISRKLAGLLGGALFLTSEVGRGSEFALYLPQTIPASPLLSKASTPPNTTWQTPKPQSPSNSQVEYPADDRETLTPESRSVLIIEDDPQFAKMLLTIAHEKNIKTLLAETGEAGLYLAEVYSPDGIILDMRLPGIDGEVVLMRLKENLATRHIPVHLISTLTEFPAPLMNGAAGFIAKSESKESLERALTRLETISNKKITKVLLVGDETIMQHYVANVIQSELVKVTPVTTTQHAKEYLNKEQIDCLVLDSGLLVAQGVTRLSDFLLDVRKNREYHLPIIVHDSLRRFVDDPTLMNDLIHQVAIKTTHTQKTVLDKVSLFLHAVEAYIPETQQATFNELHDSRQTLINKNVLVVDDDMRNVYALIQILKTQSIKPIVAKNGREALQRLQEHPDTHLVLMDIMMPEMDGFETVAKIRAMQSEMSQIPIIALTAKAMKGDRRECITAGFSDYLSKPVDTEKLFTMLKVWLH